jgi:carbon-monoxide dehydrogenase medium subunit
MHDVRLEGDRLVIGAMATHAELEESSLLKQRCSLLPQTATTIGDVQVRNRGTIGGSLAHADPAGDMPAAIVALDAEIKAVSRRGERWIKAERFFLGFLATALEPDEILTEVKVPDLSGIKTAYLKAAQRASGFAVVGIAVCVKLDRDGICNDIAIGVTGVTDRVYRPVAVEQKLKGNRLDPGLVKEAAARVADDIDVIEDINGSKEYRSHLAHLYTARAIEAAIKT